MSLKFILTFLGGLVFGAFGHYAVTRDIFSEGKTSVAAVPLAEVKPASKPKTKPRYAPREETPSDPTANANLLRQLFAETPRQFDSLTQERNAAVAELTQLSKELLLSYGTMDQAGATVGNVVRRLMDAESHSENLQITDAEHAELMREFLSLVAVSDAVRELDSNPSEASLYQSAMLQEFGGLSDQTAGAIRSILANTYRSAAERGFNLASRPAEDAEDAEDWHAARTEFYNDVYQQLVNVLSPAENEALARFSSMITTGTWNLIDPFDPSLFLVTAEQSAGAPVQQDWTPGAERLLDSSAEPPLPRHPGN